MIGPEPAAQVPQLGRAPAQEGEQGARPGRGAEEVRESVRALRELHRLHARLIEEHGAFEHVHRRRVQPRPEIHEPSSIGSLALDDGRGRLARESRGVQEIVVQQNADRAGPFEGREGGFHRTAERVVEGQHPRRLARAEDEVRQAFRPIGEGAHDQGLRRGHAGI